MRARALAARAAGALGFVALTAFFGGLVGAIVGLVLVVAWFRGASARTFWIAGLVAYYPSPMGPTESLLSVADERIPAAVGPRFGQDTIGGHAVVGIGLACILLAALRELPSARREPVGETEAEGRRGAVVGHRP